MNARMVLSAGVVVAGLAGWAVLGQSQEQTPSGRQWEYQEVQLSATVSATTTLNRFGAQGWELVGVVSACPGGSCAYWAYFKRPK